MLGTEFFSSPTPSHPASRSISRAATSTSLLSKNTTSTAIDHDPTPDSYVLRHLLRTNLEAEEEYNVRMTDISPVLRDATNDLREACVEGIKEAEEVLRWSNTRHTHIPPSPAKEAEDERKESSGLEFKIQRLREAIDEFTANGPEKIIKPFEEIIGPGCALHSIQTINKKFPLRNLFLSVTFTSNLLWTAQSIIDLLIRIENTRARRTKNKLWVPKGIRTFINIATTREDEGTRKMLGEDVINSDPSPAYVSKEGKKGRRKKADVENPVEEFIDFSVYRASPVLRPIPWHVLTINIDWRGMARVGSGFKSAA